MKKTIETVIRREVSLCDRCGQQRDHLRSCQICRKDIAYCCGTTAFLNDDTPGLIEIGIHACRECLAMTNGMATFVDMMKSEVKHADEILMGLLTRWREVAKGEK